MECYCENFQSVLIDFKVDLKNIGPFVVPNLNVSQCIECGAEYLSPEASEVLEKAISDKYPNYFK